MQTTRRHESKKGDVPVRPLSLSSKQVRIRRKNDDVYRRLNQTRLAKDPAVVRFGKYYYMYYSNCRISCGSQGEEKAVWGIGIARSTDLENWEKLQTWTWKENWKRMVSTHLELLF